MKDKKTLPLLLIIAALLVTGAAAIYLYSGTDPLAPRIRHAFSEEEVSREILFNDDHIFTNHDTGMEISGQKVILCKGGTYMLRGKLDDGQIIVDAGEDSEVKLKLNGVSVSCHYGPAVYVKSAKKVSMKLRDESENSFTETYTGSHPRKKACIYARSDLTVKGDGLLTVHSDKGHGIFSTKDLKIKGGSLKVEAAKQALHGKKSVIIEAGTLTLKAGTDGIHSNGLLDIRSGTIDIDAGKYGMYAYTGLYVNKDKEDGARVQVKHALSEAGCQGEMEY